VVDLQEDERFRSLNVELLSIAPDPVDAWREEGGAMGIREFETVSRTRTTRSPVVTV
jgi:hypothetical protein